MTWTDWILTVGLGVLLRLVFAVVVVAALALPVIALMELAPPLGRAWRRLRGFVLVEGLPWRRRDHYAPSHTWIGRRLGRGLTVGVDGLVPRLLPSVDDVRLPPPGTRVYRGEWVGDMVGGGHRAPILSPATGVVRRVNRALAPDPDRARRDPYGGGWLFTLAAEGAWTRGLRRGRAAHEWFALEARRLHGLTEAALGIAAADGGHVAEGAQGAAEDWDELIGQFLSPGPAPSAPGPAPRPSPPAPAP